MRASTSTLWRLQYIVLLALFLRIVWMVLVPITPTSDGVVYDLLAQRISDGLGYTWPDGSPTVYWPVGASAIYAGLYAAFGHDFLAVGVANALMGTLLVVAIYALARARFNEQIALLAALFAAIWPNWIAFTTILSGELPSTLLLAAGMAAILSGRRPHLLYVALGAACIVAGAFVRPTILPLVVAVPFLGALLSRGWRPAVASSLVALIIAAAAISPWAARNQMHFEKPVLVSANFGANLWMGNNPQSSGGYMALPDGLPVNEAVRDDMLRHRAFEYILENPVKYLQLSLKRVLISFDRETIGITWNEPSLPPPLLAPLKVISTAYWLILLVLSIGGMALFVWERPIRLIDPLIVSPALIAALAVLVVGGDRYHMGLMPFVAIFAASAVSWLGDRRRERQSRQVAA